MKYIPLVALLLCQTTAIGAEELPAFKTQLTPDNVPQIILAQEQEEEDDDAPCDENTSEADCAAAGCEWTDGACADLDDDARYDDEDDGT